MTNKIVCNASGVPSIYNYIGWKHTVGHSVVRTTKQLPGLSSDKRVLTFDNVTFTDVGFYSCEVSNDVKSPQTGKAYFDVKGNKFVDTFKYFHLILIHSKFTNVVTFVSLYFNVLAKEKRINIILPVIVPN